MAERTRGDVVPGPGRRPPLGPTALAPGPALPYPYLERAVSPSVPLAEPAFTHAELRLYDQGWQRFAQRQFWHAHESWEELWRHHQEPARSFLQGLIQLAAAYYLLLGELDRPSPAKPVRPAPQRLRGALRNLDKAEARLRGLPATYLHADLAALRQAIGSARHALVALGPERLGEFPAALLPPCPPLAVGREAGEGEAEGEADGEKD